MPSARVLFISNPKENLKVFPPGIFYLMSALRKESIPTRFIFVDANEAEKLENEIKSFQPTLVGATICDDSLLYYREFFSFIRNYTPAFFVIGGPTATLFPKHALLHCGAEIAIKGEAEIILVKLAKILEDSTAASQLTERQILELKQIEGLYIHYNNIKIEDNIGKTNFLNHQQMDNLFLDFSIYEEYKELDWNYISLGTSRGCAYNCLFCYHPHGRRYRAMSANKIIYELEKIAELIKQGRLDSRAKNILFVDDDFIQNKKRAGEFFAKYISKSLDAVFKLEFATSVNSFYKGKILDKELIEKISRAKPKLIQIGTDAFCDAEIKRLKNPLYTIKEAEHLVEALENHKIRNYHFWILTNLDTKPHDLLAALQTALSLLRKYEYFSFASINGAIRPTFGTPAYHQLIMRNLKFQMRAEILHKEGQDQYDFPVFTREIPLDPLVAEFLEKVDAENLRSFPHDKRVITANISRMLQIYEITCRKFGEKL